MNLDEFTCFIGTVRGTRNNNKGILFQVTMEEFIASKPDNLNLHWDVEQITNFLGQKEEYEAILVLGGSKFLKV